jgi:hypothetical protein
MDTTMMNIVALMMGSTITGMQRATILDLVANAINQLSKTQNTLMNQMAAMSYANVSAPPTCHRPWHYGRKHILLNVAIR